MYEALILFLTWIGDTDPNNMSAASAMAVFETASPIPCLPYELPCIASRVIAIDQPSSQRSVRKVRARAYKTAKTATRMLKSASVGTR